MKEVELLFEQRSVELGYLLGFFGYEILNLLSYVEIRPKQMDPY